MMLGKRTRQRPPMKRTTSLSEFSYDDLTLVKQPPPSDQNNQANQAAADLDQKVMGIVSQRSLNRRNSGDFVLESNGTSLRTCSLCNRRLAPTRDIYMYRGDSAFCSVECRQRQMIKDEWKEKSIIKESNSSSSSSHSTTSVSSTKGEKIAVL